MRIRKDSAEGSEIQSRSGATPSLTRRGRSYSFPSALPSWPNGRRAAHRSQVSYCPLSVTRGPSLQAEVFRRYACRGAEPRHDLAGETSTLGQRWQLNELGGLALALRGFGGRDAKFRGWNDESVALHRRETAGLVGERDLRTLEQFPIPRGRRLQPFERLLVVVKTHGDVRQDEPAQTFIEPRQRPRLRRQVIFQTTHGYPVAVLKDQRPNRDASRNSLLLLHLHAD